MAIGGGARAARLALNSKLYIQLRRKMQLVIFRLIPVGHVGHNFAGQVVRNAQGIRVSQQPGQLIQLFVDFAHQFSNRMPAQSFFTGCLFQFVEKFSAQFAHDSSHFHFSHISQFLSVLFGNVYIIAQKWVSVKQNF
nr:MAG TPA: hypothetical protein [Caudoviricetes sp.]